MRIRQIEYRRLVTHGEYANTTLGAVAEVAEDQAPSDVLMELEAWVDEQLQSLIGDQDAARTARQEAESARWELQRINRQRVEAREKYEQARAILAPHGIALRPPEEVDAFADMPF